MRRSLRLLPLPATLLFACARAPYYENTHVPQRAIGEPDRSFLVIDLDRAIQRGRIRTFDVRTPTERYRVHPRGPGAPILDALPLPVLTAAWVALVKPGAEWDRLVPTERGGLVPTTSWLELDGSLTIEVGPPRPEPPDTVVTADELRARYGIGPLLEHDRPWAAAELRALEQALSLLRPEELVAVAGVPFHRYGAPPTRRPKDTAALYQPEGASAQIQVYDRAFLFDRQDFYGDVSDPRQTSVGSLLHEIGHAIAGAPMVEGGRRLEALVTEYKRNIEKHNAHIERRQLAQARALQGPLKEQEAELLRLRLQLKALHRMSPIEAAYLRARGPQKGPTPYGRSSLSESFADAFSLYRADAPALRRVYPAVHEWFASGMHVRELQAAFGRPLPVRLAARPSPSGPAAAPRAQAAPEPAAPGPVVATPPPPAPDPVVATPPAAAAPQAFPTYPLSPEAPPSFPTYPLSPDGTADAPPPSPPPPQGPPATPQEPPSATSPAG